MRKNRFRFVAAAIFVLALAVRLVHVWQLRASPFFSVLMGDSRGYDEWAQRIAGGDWIGHEVFYQAPLYPYLLGLVYAVAGRSLLLARIVQVLIGSASCALIALAGARLFSERVGIAAGVMLALYAPAIFFDGLLQKSVLDVFFVCLALWLITKTETAEAAKRAWFDKLTMSGRSSSRSARPEPVEGRGRAFFSLGLALGGLALTRENAIVLIAVVAVWTALVYDIRRTALVVAGGALVLMPVAARNAYVGGGFFVTTSQAGPNFYIGNHAGADGSYQSLRFGRGAPEYERQDATELAERALGRRLTPGEVSSYWTGRAFDYITTQPGDWLRLMVRKTALLWNATEAVDTESQESHAEWSWPLRVLAPVGHFGVLVPLAILGIFATFPGAATPNRAQLALLYALIVVYAASVVAFYVFARYRYPLVPFLLLFAGAGIASLPEALRHRTVPGGGWALVAVPIAAVVCNWPLLSTTLMQAVTEGNLGAALQSEQRLDEAVQHYRRAIQLRPDYAPAYSNLGSALRAQGRLDEAVAAHQRAIELQPDFPDAHYNLANALSDEGKTAAAIEHFRIALRVIPGSAEVHNNLGIALATGGKADEAIAEFRAALAMDPDSIKAHRNLGDLLASTERSTEALDHLRRATELAPGDAAIHYDFGSVLLEAGRTDEAIKEFRASLTLAPSNAATLNNLGIALGSQGKLDEAIDQFERALKLQPDFVDARKNFAIAVQAKKGPKPKG